MAEITGQILIIFSQVSLSKWSLFLCKSTLWFSIVSVKFICWISTIFFFLFNKNRVRLLNILEFLSKHVQFPFKSSNWPHFTLWCKSYTFYFSRCFCSCFIWCIPCILISFFIYFTRHIGIIQCFCLCGSMKNIYQCKKSSSSSLFPKPDSKKCV